MIVGVPDLDTYWNMQPIRFEKYIKAYAQRKELEAKEVDAMNYSLGKYIAIAVNQPKRYPKKPFLYKEEVKKEMTIEEMERIMQDNTIKLGGQIQ